MDLDRGPLTLALAMLVGVLAQAAARHARIPGIVLLLALGVGLGPDGADLVRPHLLGAALPAFIGFAVAIILFEGALNTRIATLRAQGLAIRRLITLGALVTAVLATAAAWLLMPWDWRLSVLFGTLVIVTGPTVVNPLVRRLRLAPRLAEILLAEGILIDAVGATVAVVALEVVIAETTRAAAGEALSIFLRFGTGALLGGAAGLGLAGLLRVPRLVPAGLENVLALAVAVASFQASDAVVPESGLTAVIAAGLVIGNQPVRRLGQIAEFKEQLTDLLVATLFVLLAADVRMTDVEALGWRGALVVALLVLVVRPATVFASTRGTGLTVRDKLCLSWIGPRGIVAAAVASLFARQLAAEGIAGGQQLRGLVFVVIATTVTVQGLTAGLVASALGVRLPARRGAVILGANPLARLVAHVLHRLGQPTVLIETRPEICAAARAEGLRVVQGDGLHGETLFAAGVDSAAWCLGLTPNEQVNFLFARRISEEYRGPAVAILLERHDQGVTVAMAEHHDVDVLFRAETNVLDWLDHARRGEVAVERWRLDGDPADALTELPVDDALPLVRIRGDDVAPCTSQAALRAGDQVVWALRQPGRMQVSAWLAQRGWRVVDIAPTTAATSDLTS